MAWGRDQRDDGALLARIEAGDLDPVYCLHGVERYLVDQHLAALRKVALDPRTAGFNHDVFELRETPLATVLATARTMPMMAKRRVVVGKGVDEVKADLLEPLVEYVGDPNPSTCLILVGGKADVRFKAFQALRKAGWLHEMKPLPDRELPSWLARQARAQGVPIAEDAARTLAEIAGPDLGRLSQALEQLAIYVGDAKKITLGDVETLVAETRERGIFELTKAIGTGDRDGALALLANMLRNREPALRIQFMLARQLRQIWRARELGATGADRNEIAAAIGVPPFFMDEILGPARLMSDRALERGFRRLYEADRLAKSSRSEPEVMLSRLVQALAEDARGTPTRGARGATSGR